MAEGYRSEFEKAYERYEKTFGKEYPYIYLNLTLKEAIRDIGRRIRSKIPVPEEDYADMLKNPGPSVDKRRQELKKARLISKPE